MENNGDEHSQPGFQLKKKKEKKMGQIVKTCFHHNRGFTQKLTTVRVSIQ